MVQSENSNRLYLKELHFTSDDSGWISRYLSTREERITSLLQNTLGNEFWHHYAKVRLRFAAEGLLLLRIKSITEQSVCFTQIWTSEDVAESFRTEALRGIDMMALLKDKGISNREIIKRVTYDAVPDLIVEIRRRPHILQVVAECWRLPDMVIGDPLKKGKLYLPFPE